MKKSNLIMLVCAAAIMSGCSTIISGTSQQIHVKAVDASTSDTIKNARCSISIGDGYEHKLNSNPGKTTVDKGYGTLQVKCSAKGYTQIRTGYGKSFDSVSIANILFWPGFIVDGMTGAMLKYPSHVVVEMSKA